MSENESFYWDKFLIQGDEFFYYMTYNFENMFDGESNIKHFYIRYGRRELMCNAEEIYDEYSDDIQKELIPWIKKEFEKNNLLEKINWKPFRDQDLLNYMYLGYKRMFQYKEYYFQLAIDNEWSETENCKYCINKEYYPHFVLALYGWKDNSCENLQPDNCVSIPSDNIMPEWYWAKK